MPSLAQIGAALNKLLANFQQHRHTGIDSHKVSYNNLTDVPTGSTYAGSVTSSGTASTPFPSGWTVAHTSTGEYTITHTLGVSTYAVVSGPSTGTEGITIVGSKGTSTFIVYSYNLSASSIDLAFDFILIP